MTRREWKAEQLITLLLTEGLGELDAEGRELLLQKINELPLEKEAGKEEANVL